MPRKPFSCSKLALLIAWVVALFKGSSAFLRLPCSLPLHHATTTTTTTTTTASRSSSNTALPSAAEDFLETDSWERIRQRLNKIPTFCCSVDDGEPLSFRQVNGKLYMTPFFYCDIKAAQKEFAILEGSYQGLKIINIPLGDAFEFMSRSEAMLIPSQAAMEKAGAPVGSSPLGQPVPLFASVTKQNEQGESVLPLYMVYEEAEAAASKAKASAGSTITITLDNVVQTLATLDKPPPFDFVVPKTSLEYMKDNNLL